MHVLVISLAVSLVIGLAVLLTPAARTHVALNALAYFAVTGLLVAVGVGAVGEPAASHKALSALALRFLDAISPQSVAGLLATLVAYRLWRSLLTTSLPPPAILRFTRNWGGLGSGEGGWVVRANPDSIRWWLFVVCAVGVTGVAAIALRQGPSVDAGTPTATRDGGAVESKSSADSPKTETAAVAKKVTAPGGAGDHRASDTERSE